MVSGHCDRRKYQLLSPPSGKRTDQAGTCGMRVVGREGVIRKVSKTGGCESLMCTNDYSTL